MESVGQSVAAEWLERTFVSDLDEETEALGRLQVETMRDVLAEVLRPRTRVDLEGLAETTRLRHGDITGTCNVCVCTCALKTCDGNAYHKFVIPKM